MMVMEEVSLAKSKFEKQGIDWHKTTLFMSKKTAEKFLSEITEMKVEIIEEDGLWFDEQPTIIPADKGEDE